jgi:DNA polymerase-3 subunit gamma/tau
VAPPPRAERTEKAVAPAIDADAANEAAVAEVVETVAEVRAEQVVAEAKEVTLQQMRDSWPEILESISGKRKAWMVVQTSQARALDGDVLTVTFPNEADVADFKKPQTADESVSEVLRTAILSILGLRVKFIAKVEPTLAAVVEEIAISEADAPEPTEPESEPAVDEAGWAVAEIPGSVEPEPEPSTRPSPAARAAAAAAPKSNEPQRYGESVVREILGASFIEEQTVSPRVTPREN